MADYCYTYKPLISRGYSGITYCIEDQSTLSSRIEYLHGIRLRIQFSYIAVATYAFFAILEITEEVLYTERIKGTGKQALRMAIFTRSESPHALTTIDYSFYTVDFKHKYDVTDSSCQTLKQHFDW